jgi:hypothetical protein
MAIQQESDFNSGRFTIPTNTWQGDSLDDYITRVEAEYLPRLFGVELYDLFIADLTGVPGVPVSARFLKVFNAFNDQTGDCFTQSEGLKVMLNGLVYYYYLRDRVSRVTTDGIKLTTGENSDNVSAIGHDLTSRYNESIKSYKVIQNFMFNVDAVSYPEFKGIFKKFNHPY